MARYGLYAGALFAALPVVLLIGALTPLAITVHWPGWRIALVMWVAAPVLEEIVFRAGVQDGLATWLSDHRIAGLSRANLLTAVVFALLHLWRHPPVWALATAVPSLIFGFFYERHRHLAAPIGLHSAYNVAYLLLLQAP